ncbi:MAG TPA: N,N-dimethylformamidase beta subunit family domain-containing protein [Gaiellaceae bacterium]|nr:N,N-dimethylformamidase beta subunit family domain-containing protein [Gaiellaceae bacterium]
MRPRRLVLLLPALAAVALVSTAGAARKPAGIVPRIVGAGPVADPSDVASHGLRRVTFSPDHDGRRDQVSIRVRATAGHALSLWLAPASRGGVYLPAGKAVKGVTTVTWSGLHPDGTRYPDGSYRIGVCDSSAHLCSTSLVLAHLRILSIYAPEKTAVSAGQTIPVHVAADRLGPMTLDLASAADPSGSGIGTVEVAHPGVVRYRVPDVPHGGLWLLRLRTGTALTHFPLVVHEPTLSLAAPPPHTALVVYPLLTWRAYDMFDVNRDGVVDSWYSHPRTPVVPLYGAYEPSTIVPSLTGREPNPESQGAFARWLQSHRLTAQHVTDVELGKFSAEALQRYAAIVFEGHTEYYERGTYAKVRAYRNAGGRLEFLQGNSFYGEAKVGKTTVRRLSYRFRTKTRSDFALAATGFRSCCWPDAIRPVYRLAPGAVESLPWLFEGTGLQDGDEFGIALGEVDTVDAKLSPPDTVTVATARVPAFKPEREKEAEAWIGSKPIPYPPAWKKPQTIAIAYARTGKGEVFSWGNTGFLRTVEFGSHGVPAAQRAALDRAALNVWQRFTR